LSNFIRHDLQAFGFLLADEKCFWEPSQTVVWLGFVWDTQLGNVSVTDERIKRFEILLCSIVKNVTEGTTLIHARKLVGVSHWPVNAYEKCCRTDSETEVTCYVCMFESNGELECSCFYKC
jgi:hypothetical protein